MKLLILIKFITVLDFYMYKGNVAIFSFFFIYFYLFQAFIITDTWTFNICQVLLFCCPYIIICLSYIFVACSIADRWLYVERHWYIFVLFCRHACRTIFPFAFAFFFQFCRYYYCYEIYAICDIHRYEIACLRGNCTPNN